LESAPRIDPQFAAKIRATHLKTEARQGLYPKRDNTALECAGAGNAEPRARRGARWDLQPVSLGTLRICRIIYLYVDGGATEEVFDSDPNFLRDVAGDLRASTWCRCPARFVELTIVSAAPDRIAQDFISTIERFDCNALFIGAWVGVGMMTLSQLSIGIADLDATTAALKPEGLIMIRFWSVDR
jgi:hypothetical protein